MRRADLQLANLLLPDSDTVARVHHAPLAYTDLGKAKEHPNSWQLMKTMDGTRTRLTLRHSALLSQALKNALRLQGLGSRPARPLLSLVDGAAFLPQCTKDFHPPHPPRAPRTCAAPQFCAGLVSSCQSRDAPSSRKLHGKAFLDVHLGFHIEPPETENSGFCN